MIEFFKGLLIYVIIWWIVIFTILPIGIHIPKKTIKSMMLMFEIPRIKVDKTVFLGSTNLSEYIKNNKRARVGRIAVRNKNILSVIFLSNFKRVITH